MELSYLLNSNIPDMKDTYRSGVVTSEIRTSGSHCFYLSQTTNNRLVGNSHTQIPSFPDQQENVLFRRWKISIAQSLDVSAKIRILPFMSASVVYQSSGQFADGVTLYTSNNAVLSSGSGKLLFTSLESGEGSTSVITLPELDGVHKDLAIVVEYETAPTSGMLVISVEAQK